MIKKYFMLFIFSFSFISVIVGMCMYAYQTIEAGSIRYIIDIIVTGCFQIMPSEAIFEFFPSPLVVA